MDAEEIQVDRRDTLIRSLFTVLFILVVRVVEAVLMLGIIAGLILSLVTRRLPPEGLRRFSNRALAYLYELGRYITFNDSEPPFPFADFPAEISPPRWSGPGAEMDALGLESDPD